MKSFEAYLSQHKVKNLQKNFQYGDKLKYIGKGTSEIKPNEICTFLELQKVSGISYAKVKVKKYHAFVHPNNIIKV